MSDLGKAKKDSRGEGWRRLFAKPTPVLNAETFSNNQLQNNSTTHFNANITGELQPLFDQLVEQEQRLLAFMQHQFSQQQQQILNLVRVNAQEPTAVALENKQAVDLGTEIEALRQNVAALEKQTGRAGREQLKTSTLIEAQQQQLSEALEQLKAAERSQEAELARLRDQSRSERSAARLELVQALLPALDGLDEALRSGQNLVVSVTPAPMLEPSRRGWFTPRPAQPPPPSAAELRLREGVSAWLTGLSFVQQRLLELLASEGVRPIEATGHPYDPQHQVVLEVVPASKAGVAADTVVAELRRGYLAGNRVLRYAEVSVAQDDSKIS